MNTTHTTTAALLALALSLSACSTPREEIPVEPAPSPDTEEADTVAADGQEEGPAEPLDLSSEHVFDDGLAVALSNIARARTSPQAYPEDSPYLGFTVTWTNETGSQVNLAMASVNCVVGEDGRESDTVFDSGNGVDSSFASTLLDGNTATGDFGCEMDEDETRIQVEIALWEETPYQVIFAGEVE